MSWILFLFISVALSGHSAFFTFAYEVRLIPPAGSTGGETQKGTVLVRYNASSPWGLVCDDSFDILDARVICRMLGFTSANLAITNSGYGSLSNFSFLLDDLQCNGYESNLKQCMSSPFGTHNCDRTEQAGVSCAYVPPRYEVIILPPVNEPTTIAKGTALVRYNSSWGVICDHGWDLNDANVFCRMLGFRKAFEVFVSSSLGVRNYQFLLDDLECTGNETQLGECRSSRFGTHNCGSTDQAGVRCTNSTEVNACLQNPCRNLGTCVSTQGTASCICPIQWTGSFCEYEFNPCISNPCQNNGTCTSSQGSFTCVCKGLWVGRLCENAYMPSRYEVRILPPVNEPSAISKGTALVRYNSSWGVICDHGWDLNDANVFCRMLGYRRAFEVYVSSSLGVQNYQFLLDDLDCTGNETHIGECRSSRFGTHNCASSEQAGVRCTYSIEVNACLLNPCSYFGTCVSTQGTTSCICPLHRTGRFCEYVINPCSSNPCQNNGTCTYSQGSFTCVCKSLWVGRLCENAYVPPRYEVRILPPVNEPTAVDKGTALVRYNSSWGVICDHGWDLNDANVFCRMLGFRKAFEVFDSSSLGVQNYEFLLDDLDCTGNETHLGECRSARFGTQHCASLEQAGVRCTNSTEVNACLQNPCWNYGTCVSTQGNASCICFPGWIGSFCENYFNPCITNPCRNNGTCTSEQGSFMCTCKPQWMGQLCEKDANVIRRLDIVAAYNVSCSRMVDATFTRALQYLVNYKYSDIESILSGIARRSADTNATSACLNDSLTLTWPTSLIYPANVTSVPSDVLNQIINAVTRSCVVLEMIFVSSTPVVLKPVVTSRNVVLEAVLTSSCINKLPYSTVTDSCITNMG